MAIATVEPQSVRAGDTIAWTKSLSDYPAPTWTLKYRLINAAGALDITAGASGADHAVTVAAAVSTTWQPGRYTWQSYVTSGAQRFTLATGVMEVLPDLAKQAAGYETRSTARVILDQLEAAYKTYITNGQGHIQKYQIGEREMWFRSASDFIKQIEYWRSQTASEDAAAAIAAGLGNPRRLYVRFA